MLVAGTDRLWRSMFAFGQKRQSRKRDVCFALNNGNRACPNRRCLKALGRTPHPKWGLGKSCLSISQLPTASLIHFLVKLSFAAPANFFSAADLLQAAFASVSHFFMKLVIAAPASFLLPASILHESA